MKALSRLTLLDIGLIAALILTGVLWALNSSSNRNSGSLDDVDMVAWEAALGTVSDALLAGNLQASKSALLTAAEVAAPANDGAAIGIRAFADALDGVNLTAADIALGEIDPLPYQSPLFEQFYYTIWLTLFYPEFPVGQSAPGAEWTQANLILPDEPILQYWGTATWALPTEIAELAGEADIAMPDIDLTGKLMLADDGEAMQISLVFLGPYADLDIVDILGFWTSDGSEEALLAGTIVAAQPGAIVMSLEPEARDDNVRLLRNANEIGVAIDLAGARRLILRVEIGDSGRAVIGAGLTNPE